MHLTSTRNDKRARNELENLNDNAAEKKKVHNLKTPTYEPSLFYERMINDL